MILVCIYGPAASGKLTIAKEVGTRTGFPVFHNHLVVDMLVPVFGFGTPPFVELRERAMLDVIRRAAVERLPGLLFTFTPERTVRHRFIVDLNTTVAVAGGQTVFVELTCPEEELERRMENESRAEFGKVNSLAQYRRLHDSGAFNYPPIPHWPDHRYLYDGAVRVCCQNHPSPRPSHPVLTNPGPRPEIAAPLLFRGSRAIMWAANPVSLRRGRLPTHRG